MLHVMRNIAYLGNTMIETAVENLQTSLPGSWQITVGKPDETWPFQADGLLAIRSPDGTDATIVIEAKRSVTPRQAAEVARRLGKTITEQKLAGAILISEYISGLSRKRLRKEGVGYIDLTGNRWIALETPGLLIETNGAEVDPSPPDRAIRSLKGAKAARIVRALCDTFPLLGVRELARMVGADPGYTSRVLDFLYTEDLIERGERGEVVEINWQDLLRRWSQDYSFTDSNRVITYLAPRGLEDLFTRLPSYEGEYALTGSFAVPAEASIVAGRLAACYVRDIEGVADHLQVRLAETGANVLLVEPFDRLVFDRVRLDDGMAKVALSQCAVDLLTSGGRGPAEADALIAWMQGNEERWRS
jgi:hypothetical protein